jgi:hypothetical protein
VPAAAAILTTPLTIPTYAICVDNNFTSFQRQLNLYGFRRLRFGGVNNSSSALLAGVVLNASADSTGGYKGTYIYSHPLFVFNRRDLCDTIRRMPMSPSRRSSSKQKQGSTSGDDLRGLSVDADGDDIYSVLLSMKESIPSAATTDTTTASSTTNAGSVDSSCESCVADVVTTAVDGIAAVTSDNATAVAALGLKAFAAELAADTEHCVYRKGYSGIIGPIPEDSRGRNMYR